MLRKSTFTIALLGVLAFAFTVSAQTTKNPFTEPATLGFKAVSEQAKDGTIMGKDGFTIDILMNYDGKVDLTGGSFGIQLTSPDKSIKKIIHTPVDTAAAYYKSVQFMDVWKKGFDALNMINIDEPYGFNGDLPDSAYFIFAGITGIKTGLGEIPVIRFNLQAEGPGKLCVDSIGKASSDFDWLFPANITATFKGPYCWDLK